MIPIIELRGAIPIGVASGLPLAGTYITAIIGNMLPVPIIILFSKKVLLWCCRLPGAWGKPFNWIYSKGVKAGDKMQEKAGRGLYVALFLFVAIPLPGTGAWSGSLIAALLDVKMRYALPSVIAGVFAAGVIMTVASYGLLGAIQLF